MLTLTQCGCSPYRHLSYLEHRTGSREISCSDVDNVLLPNPNPDNPLIHSRCYTATAMVFGLWTYGVLLPSLSFHLR